MQPYIRAALLPLVCAGPLAAQSSQDPALSRVDSLTVRVLTTGPVVDSLARMVATTLRRYGITVQRGDERRGANAATLTVAAFIDQGRCSAFSSFISLDQEVRMPNGALMPVSVWRGALTVGSAGTAVAANQALALAVQRQAVQFGSQYQYARRFRIRKP